MDKVWVVTKGEYSDYHIVRIFSNQEQAEKYAATFSRTSYGEAARVEEYPLDGSFDRQSIYWHVIYWHSGWNGKTGRSAKREEELPEKETLNEVVDLQKKHNWNTPHLGVWVQADSEDKAYKIGSDLVTQYLAEQQGIA